MKCLEIFLLLLAVSIGSAFILQKPGNATLQRVIPGIEKKAAVPYARILNGAKATRKQFPYIVGLDIVSKVQGRGGSCGGALISHEWILTAAHCTIAADYVRVYIGMHKRVHPEINYFITSKDIVPHKDFNETYHLADIALILILHVDYTEFIQPIDLPQRVSPPQKYVGTSAIVSGWGVTSPTGKTSVTTLRYTTLIVISNEACERIYSNERIYPGKLCTSGHTIGAVCSGDSGGPLVLTGTKTLIGITSGVHKEGCEKGYPIGFTRVDHYLEWIHEKTKIPI